MERIQEAMERARKERQHVLASKPSTQQHHGVGAINVEYSHTKRIKLSDEELKQRKLFAGMAHDSRSEPYRQLRSQVLKKMRAQNWRTLAVTSPREGNGKTLTAINLAISLSQEVNQTVMLVDLNLRNPGVASAMGLDDIEHGIIETLSGHISLEDILINPGYNRLVIAPCTPQGAHTSEILSSPAMKTLQQELLGRYDDRLIIFDLPALLSSDDALVFTPNVDATLLVIEDGGSTKDELARSINLLKDSQLIGTVINKAHN